jgi:predicted nucleotidyltransferase
MSDGLHERYREWILGVLSKNPRIEKVVLFGSRATGSFHIASDIDLALFGDQLTLTDLCQLSEALDELSIPQTIDLLLFDRVKNETLRAHIERDGVEWRPDRLAQQR